MTTPDIEGATVLITGGTGSLGQTLVRRLLTGELGVPRQIIVFSRDEAKQYAMKTSWKRLESPTDEVIYHNFDELIEFRIGDVRDYAAVEDAVSVCDVVFHAAAMKQVPTCEYFPSQAVATNVLGAENVVRAARRTERPHTVLAVSTDKACKPINVMGMTKALQERIVIEGNLQQDRCRMLAVRYGNVLSSRGSVIPLFKQQIAHGGQVGIGVVAAQGSRRVQAGRAAPRHRAAVDDGAGAVGGAVGAVGGQARYQDARHALDCQRGRQGKLLVAPAFARAAHGDGRLAAQEQARRRGQRTAMRGDFPGQRHEHAPHLARLAFHVG